MTDIVITPRPTTNIIIEPSTTPLPAAPTIVVDSSRGGAAGPAGPTGPQGQQGVQGPPGPTLAYTHTQNVPSTTWVITHGLGIYPQVSTIEFGGAVIEGDVQYLNTDTLTVTFTVLVGGYAYLS